MTLRIIHETNLDAIEALAHSLRAYNFTVAGPRKHNASEFITH